MKKFQFHWGHMVIVLLGAFIVFIVTLLATAGDTGSLVTEEYYKEELLIEDKINAQKRVNQLSKLPTWKRQANGIVVVFPPEVSNGSEGTAFLLYSAANNQDVRVDFNVRNQQILIPAHTLKPGEYTLEVAWEDGEEYLWKTTVQWETP